MTIEKKGFTRIIPDNELTYYSYLQGVIESVDYNSSMSITKGINSVNFRVAPSNPKAINTLIEEINKINSMFNLRVNFSKSMKTCYSINFSIEF